MMQAEHRETRGLIKCNGSSFRNGGSDGTFLPSCALSFSPTWSAQDGLSLTSQADARVRVYIRTGYAASPAYYTAAGLPWYAVRACYFGGPWSGPGYTYAGWGDYAKRNDIACTPGTAIKGGDGHMYVCQ